MSSGSNAPRKPSVASTLFKASSRFLHGGRGNGQGAGSKSMKRQRAGHGSVDREALSAESNNSPDAAAAAAALDHEQKDSSGEGPANRFNTGAKSKKRFVGVRQRPSGRWVAEIKDTTQKIRLWLGTFDSAEEGAKAYDSAARALRGANTRTNFVPAMACEGTVPASKAARLIRLRQIAAAAKEARNVTLPEAKADPNLGKAQEKLQERSKADQVINNSPLVRQDFQQSSSLDPPLPSAAVDDPPPPHLPSSPPPKPARLIGRRHTAPLASAKREQEDDAPAFAASHDHGKVDDGTPKLEAGCFPSPKLEPQLSTSSENLSNAKNLPNPTAGSPKDSSPSPSPPLRLPSPRAPFDRMQSNSLTVDHGRVQSVNSLVEATAAKDQVISFNKQVFSTHRTPQLDSFSAAFPVDNFVPPPPFHVPALEPSRPSFRADHNVVSGLGAYPHHRAIVIPSPHQISSCATNRDHVSAYVSESKDEVCRGRSLRSSMGQLLDDVKCSETRAAKLPKEEMDYTSSEIYRMAEAERKPADAFDLREKEFAELVPDIPWPDYVLMDETGMESGLLGLDLSCEHSGVYTSAFDFSAEAIDRDSCTSVLEDHLPADSGFSLLRMQFQQSSCSSQSFEECVLLTEPPELDYCMSSPPESRFLGPPMSPHSLSVSSSLLWRPMDDTSAWDGQSSGSTETTGTTGTELKPNGDGGECTSQDNEALWNSMDLPPLCMVA